MKTLHFPTLSLVTIAASIATMTLPTTLGHRSARDVDPALPAAALGCRLDGAAGRATTRVLLTNVGDRPLPSGARYAWTTLGTPAPQGEMHALQAPLERGASVAVVPAMPVHGSGCMAVRAG